MSPQTTLFSRRDLAQAFTNLEVRLANHRGSCASRRRVEATHFNVFDLFKPSENILSDILALLLSPSGTHGQGGLFLGLLVNRVRPDLAINPDSARVVRESLTYTIRRYRRRIDLVTTMPDFTLAVENKKFSAEGDQQIQHYCKHLSNIAGDQFCLIFLNRTGAEAKSITRKLADDYKHRGQLALWSWEKNIPAWLQECRSRCASEKIRHFLSDFEVYIATYLATADPLPDEDEPPQ